MIRVVVFSRDRALQVHATLSSLNLQALDASTAQISVLFRRTSARYVVQYNRLAAEFRDRVSFVEETNFRSQVVDLLGGLPNAAEVSRQDVPKTTERDYCLFLVDDSIFIRQFWLQEAVAALDSNPDALGYSFRLGQNTTLSYSLDRPQRLPSFHTLGGGILKYRWDRADGDFGYPLEVSSSLYPLGIILGLLQGLAFDSPSSLESQMSLRAGEFARSRPALLCFERSVAFSAPLNRVQEVFSNRSGNSPAFSTENLADLFEAGKRLNVRALQGFVPQACHQEIQPEFE